MYFSEGSHRIAVEFTVKRKFMVSESVSSCKATIIVLIIRTFTHNEAGSVHCCTIFRLVPTTSDMELT